jgi:hypothetical protein
VPGCISGVDTESLSMQTCESEHQKLVSIFQNTYCILVSIYWSIMVPITCSSRRVCSALVAQLRSLAPALGGEFGHGDLDVERVERLGISSSLPASRLQWLHLGELDVPSSRDEVVRWKEDMGKSTWTRGTQFRLT